MSNAERTMAGGPGALRSSTLASESVGACPTLTIVVPTRNEEGNVAPLCALLDDVLRDESIEVLFVDDSDDGTPEAVQRVGEGSRRPVRLVHRTPQERRSGLGGAVVEGIRRARGPWVCVMDGDLQHPPALIEQMLAEARDGSYDVVVASRFQPGGDADQFGAGRRALSWLCTHGAHALFPSRLRGVSDPMSGFFLLRRDAIDLERLRPRGFKILVEILVRTSGLRVSEVGFHFGKRYTGDS
jgi:dolichol-phosphate mannosyltransferase